MKSLKYIFHLEKAEPSTVCAVVVTATFFSLFFCFFFLLSFYQTTTNDNTIYRQCRFHIFLRRKQSFRYSIAISRSYVWLIQETLFYHPFRFFFVFFDKWKCPSLNGICFVSSSYECFFYAYTNWNAFENAISFFSFFFSACSFISFFLFFFFVVVPLHSVYFVCLVSLPIFIHIQGRSTFVLFYKHDAEAQRFSTTM